jgi:hypothetical protein
MPPNKPAGKPPQKKTDPQQGTKKKGGAGRPANEQRGLGRGHHRTRSVAQSQKEEEENDAAENEADWKQQRAITATVATGGRGGLEKLQKMYAQSSEDSTDDYDENGNESHGEENGEPEKAKKKSTKGGRGSETANMMVVVSERTLQAFIVQRREPAAAFVQHICRLVCWPIIVFLLNI